MAMLPAAALGATASISIKRVFYAATPGEVNNLTVSLSGTDYVLTDAGATVEAGPGCTASGNTGTCPGTGIIGITVSGGDGADSLTNSTNSAATPSTLSGGDGNDSLAAAPRTTRFGEIRGSTASAAAPGMTSSTSGATGATS